MAEFVHFVLYFLSSFSKFLFRDLPLKHFIFRKGMNVDDLVFWCSFTRFCLFFIKAHGHFMVRFVMVLFSDHDGDDGRFIIIIEHYFPETTIECSCPVLSSGVVLLNYCCMCMIMIIMTANDADGDDVSE